MTSYYYKILFTKKVFVLRFIFLFLHLRTSTFCKPIALVTPDSTNTKLVIHESGLRFLSSLTAPLAIVAVSGRAKTGKSFMMNQILGVSDKNSAFPVGISFTPGTKGLLLWDQPHYYTIPDCSESSRESLCNITVVFMDTEGLGTAGVPADSYDPKICALSVLLSSLLIYNVNHDILAADVNLLHSVVALSSIFETDDISGRKPVESVEFPFPPMLWTVQQFEHELGNTTPEEVLRRALSEAKHPYGMTSPEITKYNETVRIIKEKFPDFGDPRILLMHRPHNIKMSQLPQLNFMDFKLEYRQQIEFLRNLIRQKLRPKSFASYLPPEENNGRFVADLVSKTVMRMNEIESANVGATLVKQLSEQLYRRAFNLYCTAMNNRMPLPQDEDDLKRVHTEEMTKYLNLFKTKCAGGLDKFGNMQIYQELVDSIETWFQSQLNNNTFVAKIYCSEQIDKIFEKIWLSDSTAVEHTVDSFDREVARMINKYNMHVRGPKTIKVKALEDILSKLHMKRLILLHQEAKKDFSTMSILCLVIFAISYVLYHIISMVPDGMLNPKILKVLVLIKLFCLLLFVWLFALHLNLVEVSNDSLISFASIQMYYRAVRMYFTVAITCIIMLGFIIATSSHVWTNPKQKKHSLINENSELIKLLTDIFKKQNIPVAEEEDESLQHNNNNEEGKAQENGLCLPPEIKKHLRHVKSVPKAIVPKAVKSRKIIIDEDDDDIVSDLILPGVTPRSTRRMLNQNLLN
jgi:hypothetical protein